VRIKLLSGEVAEGVFTDTGHREKCAMAYRHWTPEEKKMAAFLAGSCGMDAYVRGVFRLPDGREVKAVRLARPDECQQCAQPKKQYLEPWRRACGTCIEVE